MTRRPQIDAKPFAQRWKLSLDLKCRGDGASGVVVISYRDVEERHHSIANVLVDEGTVLHERVGRTAQEGVDNLVSSLWPELVRQLSEAAEISEEDRKVDEPSLFGVGVTATADIRIAGAAPNAEEAE